MWPAYYNSVCTIFEVAMKGVEWQTGCIYFLLDKKQMISKNLARISSWKDSDYLKENYAVLTALYVFLILCSLVCRLMKSA